MKHYKLLYPLIAVLVNLAIAYGVYFIARVAFLIENWGLFSEGMTTSHLLELFRGGIVFDTSAVLYTNALWVVMMLFPVYKKENPTYHKIWNHWYFFLLAALLVYSMWKSYMTPKLDYRQLKWKPYAIATFVSLLAYAPFSVAGMRGGWTRDVRPITISNANNYCDRPTEAGIVLNTPFSLIRTYGFNEFEVPDFFQSEAEMAKIFEPIHQPADSTTFKKKNVVVIIIESFGREYIGAYNKHLEGGKYKGYTPFADSLIAHSLTYTHSYCNGRKSIDGMPSILSSIPMFVEPFFLSPYSNNAISGIADCLNGKGGSMGFMAFARATKFQEYYGREDFVADKRTVGDDAFDGWWGISDEPFLQYMNLKLSEMPQPFMAAVFTLSSHHPFRVPDPYKEVYKEEEMPIHKVIRYTDNALRKFFESAKKEPWFENTIFAITSDPLPSR